MIELSLITPTGSRPEAFALCEKWIANQSYQSFEWLVLDDGEIPTPMTQNQCVIRPDKKWDGKENTQAENLKTLLDCVSGKYVAVIEDDDYYGPNYLGEMVNHLKRHPLVGQRPGRYYHISGHYRVFQNEKHASLSQTAFHRDYSLILSQYLKSGATFIDVNFWRNSKNGFLFESVSHVGIKGMPGRPGIGIGHRDFMGYGWNYDPHILKKWIGEDADFYGNNNILFSRTETVSVSRL